MPQVLSSPHDLYMFVIIIKCPASSFKLHHIISFVFGRLIWEIGSLMKLVEYIIIIGYYVLNLYVLIIIMYAPFTDR